MFLIHQMGSLTWRAPSAWRSGAPSELLCQVCRWLPSVSFFILILFVSLGVQGCLSEVRMFELQSDPVSGWQLVSALKMVQWFKTPSCNMETWDRPSAQPEVTTLCVCVCVCVFQTKTKQTKNQANSKIASTKLRCVALRCVALRCVALRWLARGITDYCGPTGSWRKLTTGESGGAS